jgi:folylpolyglutamate synthase/dihydropteroate synthase
MGHHLVVPENHLLSTLQHVEDKAQVSAWQEAQLPGPSQIQKRARAICEAAAENPVAMTIFARVIIKGESYAQALQFVSSVTNRKISNGAARVLVHRMLRSIEDA